MRMKTVCLVVLLLCLVGSTATLAAKGKKKKDEGATKTEQASAKKPEAADEKKKKGEKSFEDVIEDFEAIEGLFTFYRNEKTGQTYIEIKPDQLDKTFLCSMTRQAGDGFFFDSGAMLGEFPFQFRRVGEKIEYDGASGRVTNSAEANALLSRTYRPGWTLDG